MIGRSRRSHRASRERILFLEALELDDPTERGAYLRGAASGDEALLGCVERLLEQHGKSGGILDRPLSPAAPSETVGCRIGPYTLVQKLGEGGMGVVWVAEQDTPVRRRVALKVLRPGLDSDRVVQRFEVERQALALMDHPHIARVFDAGTTAHGRPYVVMELVKGEPITKYCDLVQESVRDRLALFVQVCHAVQHAHHKGVIHRDLKPGNILVAIQDQVPVPKVIDFGVAKSLGQKLSDKTLYTEFGQVMGTPEYMPPEQAELSGMDVDTRADVYALGVLLFELLTGSTPVTRERLRSSTWGEIVRAIKEEDAPQPSTRLRTCGPTLITLAARSPDRPARTHQPGPGRARLGRPQGAGEGPHPPLLIGSRAGPRRRTIP